MSACSPVSGRLSASQKFEKGACWFAMQAMQPVNQKDSLHVSRRGGVEGRARGPADKP